MPAILTEKEVTVETTTGPPTVEATVRVPRGMWVAVGIEAAVRGCSKAEVVRLAIEDYLADYTEEDKA